MPICANPSMSTPSSSFSTTSPPDVTDPPGFSLPRAGLKSRDAPVTIPVRSPLTRAAVPYFAYLAALGAAVVLILTSGGFDVAAPGLKTLAGTVDLIATAAMAYYLLGEFLLEGERWALISGLCFALIAGTVVAVVLPLTLAGSSTSSGWYGPADR